MTNTSAVLTGSFKGLLLICYSSLIPSFSGLSKGQFYSPLSLTSAYQNVILPEVKAISNFDAKLLFKIQENKSYLLFS
jgi:hypothetical protein